MRRSCRRWSSARVWRCMRYFRFNPRKPTFFARRGMSQGYHMRTHAPQQTGESIAMRGNVGFAGGPPGYLRVADMQQGRPIRDASHIYEVQRRVFHAERPGFRILELQLSPTQKVPWHSHTNISDTFYVLEGHMRLFLLDPKEEVNLKPVEVYVDVPAPRRSSAASAPRPSPRHSRSSPALPWYRRRAAAGRDTPSPGCRRR